ncbi:MAG TPA: hypothetical protein EYQ83_12490 [Acidobacteria bacterium]|nr:hypothetical protein [Acidobacteriota bacterium]
MLTQINLLIAQHKPIGVGQGFMANNPPGLVFESKHGFAVVNRSCQCRQGNGARQTQAQENTGYYGAIEFRHA